MSIASIHIILQRIEAATPESPIAVFLTPLGDLDAVFANTLLTQRRIQNRDLALIAVYDGDDDMRAVGRDLRDFKTFTKRTKK